MSFTSRLADLLGSVLRSPEARRAARDLARAAAQKAGGDRSDERSDDRSPQRSGTRASSRAGTAQDDDRRDGALADRDSSPALALRYAPVDDERADPGEVVWAWVAFEEDITQGKDRPVLVIAREDASVGGRDGDGQVLVALMFTSHDRGRGTHTDEHGNTWVDVGTGAWDRQGRPSEVRADRLLRIPIDAVRREGARLDSERFSAVADAVAEVHGWR